MLDGNHPLAGIALRLALVVRDVREATEDEIEAGSVGSSAVSVLAAPPPGHAACTSGAQVSASFAGATTPPSGVVTGPLPLKRSSAR